MYFILSDSESQRLVKNEEVGYETLASNLNRKFIGYPAISETLFLQILLFF